MKKPLSIHEGTVLAIPVDGREAALAQVVAQYASDGCLLIAVFAPSVAKVHEISPSQIEGRELALLSLTFDAKIVNGDWPVIGIAPVRADIPLPAYRVASGHPDNVLIEDFSGSRSRPAEPEELDRVPLRRMVSPAVLEMATKAFHGSGEWLPGFEGLRPSPETSTDRLFAR